MSNFWTVRFLKTESEQNFGFPHISSDVGYLCANFSLPRPLCSRLRPDVRDRRQTSDRRASLLNAPPPSSGGIINAQNISVVATGKEQMVAVYPTVLGLDTEIRLNPMKNENMPFWRSRIEYWKSVMIVVL